MKRIKFSLLNVLLFLSFILPMQSLFAGTVEVPLKKGDDGSGGIPGTNIMSMSTSSSFSINPVTVLLVDNEIVVDFSKSVGIVHITVEDQNGNVVYQDVIDTNSSIESLIDTSGWNSGNYTISISYGFTKLSGNFQL